MAQMINYGDDELLANPFAFAAQAPVLTPVSAPVVQAAAPVALVAPPLAELGPSRRGDVQPAPTGPSNAQIQAGVVDVPKPPAILAEEQRLGGKQLEPIYAQGTISRGQGGASQTLDYGPPIGYRYDNGQSQYVNFDATGEYQGTADRQKGIDPALLLMLLPILGPMAFEALGLTGAGGGGLLGEAAVLGGAGEATALTAEQIAAANAASYAANAAKAIPSLAELVASGTGAGSAGALNFSTLLANPAALDAAYGLLSQTPLIPPPFPSGPPSTPGTPTPTPPPPPQLTPAAIESGLGTPGYGVNASAVKSGLFNPELIGSGAYLPFEGVTPTAAPPVEPSKLPSWATVPNALMAAGLVSSIAKANETAPTATPFTMAPYVPPSGKPFANIAMSPIATPYTPTRILGQYDPTMTPGGVSPYELIMQQMQALNNLYADFEAGTNIGGFDPQRFVTPAAPSNFNGGMIDKSRMVGPNPMGPDNGFASIQDGEFVMNRKATQKYGIELMNAINSGKISKGKLSGLLEA